jgi:KDO2-lipid IV(A) lauroyltransferase
LKNILEYILFLLLSYFCRILGLNLSRKFASVIGFVFYYLIPIRKDVVLDNLKHAFPELSENKIKQLAYKNYKSFSITLVEILYMPAMNETEIKKVIIFENTEILKKHFKDENGIILLSGHFGNWELGAISIGINLKKKIFLVAKPQRNTYVNSWMDNQRTKYTNQIIPLGISVKNVYTALKNKQIIGLAADQRGPEDSIKLEFFGRKTSVYTGPAVLSLKTNSPLIYGLAVRQKDNSYKAAFEEISKENLPDNYDEKVKILSERILKYLEKIIREYPEQWFWMHKRWKH